MKKSYEFLGWFKSLYRMEILIAGLILVALMVYASTKIKKSAARAYEPEVIETDDFFILKPEGFINPLNGDNEFAFLAYSKEFGTGGTEDIREASARISVYVDDNFDDICDRAKESVTEIISAKSYQSGGSRHYIIAAESEENGKPIGVYFKIATNDPKVYTLHISVLSEHKENYLRRIEEMIDSFVVK